MSWADLVKHSHYYRGKPFSYTWSIVDKNKKIRSTFKNLDPRPSASQAHTLAIKPLALCILKCVCTSFFVFLGLTLFIPHSISEQWVSVTMNNSFAELRWKVCSPPTVANHSPTWIVDVRLAEKQKNSKVWKNRSRWEKAAIDKIIFMTKKKEKIQKGQRYWGAGGEANSWLKKRNKKKLGWFKKKDCRRGKPWIKYHMLQHS